MEDELDLVRMTRGEVLERYGVLEMYYRAKLIRERMLTEEVLKRMIANLEKQRDKMNHEEAKMENREELLDLMRRLVREEPETAAQILARLVTKFEVTLVVHRQEGETEQSHGWMVTVGEMAGPAAETH